MIKKIRIIFGNASLSHLNFKSQPKDNSMGYSHSFSFSKTSGNLTYSIAEELSDTKYTSNDLGILQTIILSIIMAT